MSKYKTFEEWWDWWWNNWNADSSYGLKETCGKAWNAALDSLPKKRSNQQNRYYWGVVCKLAADSTGYTPEEIHEFHKHHFRGCNQKYIQIVDNDGSGDIGHLMITTKNMTTKEFNEWIETKLIPFWAEQDVYIPMPNEEELWKSLLEKGSA